MNDKILEKMTSDFLSLGFTNNVFAWQGGEPALMGLSFYKRAIELQKKYKKQGMTLTNSFQTNATMLDKNWCKFFNENNFLLGISLDGPKHFHDYYRKDFAENPTFDKVMDSIELCRKNNIEFNIIVLLNDKNIKCPDELFDFFVENNFMYLQFIPCVEKDNLTGKLADFSITGEEYGQFMCQIFERWKEFGITKLSIGLFDSIINYFVNGCHSDCTFQRKCDNYIVLEHNGDAYCCDFFVNQDTRLGNIMQKSLNDLFHSPVKKEFANMKKQLCHKCFVCHYSEICRGGCLKDRTFIDKQFSNPSHLCDSYKIIFDKIAPQLAGVAEEFLRKRKNQND